MLLMVTQFLRTASCVSGGGPLQQGHTLPTQLRLGGSLRSEAPVSCHRQGVHPTWSRRAAAAWRLGTQTAVPHVLLLADSCQPS